MTTTVPPQLDDFLFARAASGESTSANHSLSSALQTAVTPKHHTPPTRAERIAEMGTVPAPALMHREKIAPMLEQDLWCDLDAAQPQIIRQLTFWSRLGGLLRNLLGLKHASMRIPELPMR
jgi:hypothetical protein